MKTDKDLVEEIKSGKTEHFKELVLRHEKFLQNSVNRMTKDPVISEDIIQETFIKALCGIHTFQNRSTFRSWIYIIAVNTARNWFRKNSSEIPTEQFPELQSDDNLESTFFSAEMREILGKEIESLPPRQRKAFIHRMIYELSFKDISEIMNCPYNTAKANYRHALLKLREIFKDGGIKWDNLAK